jgi:hypothetical protein
MFLYNKIIFSDKEIETVKNIILDKEEYVKSLGPDVYSGTANNSLTGRYSIFNWLSIKEISDILVPKLKNIFQELNWQFPVSIQCWANTFRNGEGIKIHKHGKSNSNDSFYCANIFISGDAKPGTTYYEEGLIDANAKFKTIENELGKIIIFTSEIYHEVAPNKNKNIRISMAMDFYPGIVKEDLNRYHVVYLEPQ